MRRSIQRLFHVTDVANWASIQEHGLLSTRARLDRAKLTGQARAAFERHRPSVMVLPDNTSVRDQKPMTERMLQVCLLGGLAPQDWYDRLNGYVFFWADEKRLETMMTKYKHTPQVVLTFDAERVLGRYGDRACVTSFNTGAVAPAYKKRCFDAFLPYSTWLAGEGGRAAEVVIDYAVPDAADFRPDVRLIETLSPGG